ncbi:MAG TPA: reverse transcriptase domain-containing protein [Ktedonobacteraceae bacterium]|nr:reverse transcriptase domain-containing protein [Ktedonobacteraceae bacterium]
MKERNAPGSRRPQERGASANQSGNKLPWSALEQQVVRMQKQIAQASQRNDRQAVHSLQQRLMESEAARLLAVRRVTEENQGKNTPGVDGVKSLTSEERLVMAASIHPKHWSHQPSLPGKRVWIAKPGVAERRPLTILPMIDRCKQGLVKLALEPEWEVRFEPHSYGFRPGRGGHDAIAAIQVAIERQPSFVFDADIEGAFDHINQVVVLEKLQTYPALHEAISAWLKVGVMDGNRYVPSETGIPQGGALSPLLMNVALHGMETVVTEGSSGGRGKEPPLLVRYADDFVILHADLGELQQAIRRVRHWLAAMGLQLHSGKTRITHTLTPYQGQVGFDFLGFHIQQEPKENSGPGKSQQEYLMGPRGRADLAALPRWLVLQLQASQLKTIITPSEEASKRHLAAIDQRLQQVLTAPQKQVIAELNPLILGWASYYNGVVPATTMSRYDDLLEQRLIRWASKRHPGRDRDWLLSRYWRRNANQRRVFATAEGSQLRPYRQSRILKG